ncbi:MAG: N-6 DNA methylase, partial [bacterium]|nr:N-6 DNA methylase [bacterium]
ESGELETRLYYHQLLRLVYRLIFLFVAEERGVLLDPAADSDAGDRYQRFYATSRLRRLAQRRRTSPYVDLWQALRLVMTKLDEGSPELALPALDSYLWRGDAVSWLIDAELGNEDLLEAVFAMSHIIDKGVRLPVAWRSLGSEELGSIYEALLELHPKIHREAAVFELETAAGHERKTTGSYYTPSSLVDCLLDTALDPVLDEAAKQDDPERAILELKVCDPACGSGHFLVAAARRIARRLAAVRSGDEEPSPEQMQRAVRDVVGRSIYGVDINPMAVELCKVSLWMEAIEPGKPLSFLDHHIQVGNSLLGATPALLRRGIPDKAFTAIEGDDKAYCRELRKMNAKDRTGQRRLFAPDGDPMSRFGDLAVSLRQLEAIDDGTVEGIRRKETHWNELRDSTAYRYGRMWTDAWCAAFVWEKVDREDRPFPITEEFFRRMEQNPRDVMPGQAEEIRRLARQYRFFHWHLAFPDVFHVPLDRDAVENEVAGWSGGFDVVLGNPPWERIKLQEKEFFSTRSPEVVRAPNAAARRRMIAALEEDDPALFADFLAARRRSEGASQLIRGGGGYPLCGRGDVNTYSVFAELNRTLIAPNGRVGCIVPSGIATDDTTKYFFDDIVSSGALVTLFSFFEIRRIFLATDSRNPFCLLTLANCREPTSEAEFAFDLRSLDELQDENRSFSLSADEVALLNPNTRTCPIFRSRRDAEITKAVYRRVPVLIKEGSPEENPWGLSFLRMLDMANDSGMFCTHDQLSAAGWTLRGNVFRKDEQTYYPLYEAKMVHHFTHRFGDYHDRPKDSESTALPDVPASRLAGPSYVPEPRYWVPAAEVEDRLSGRWDRGWLLGWRDICRSTDERTVIAAAMPRVGVGHTTPIMIPGAAQDLVAVLLSNLSSFVFDYIARQKIGGTHLTYGFLKQLPLLVPSDYSVPVEWHPPEQLRTWIRSRVLDLSYTTWDLKPFAEHCGYDGPPFRWDEDRRFLLRCELDAAFFHLYGIERDDVDYIMETFPIVKKRDVKKHGDYRTKRMILNIYDAMQRAIETAEPYQTLLDPPPADPRVAHPPREEDPLPEPLRFPVPAPEEVYPTEPPELMMVAEPQEPYDEPGDAAGDGPSAPTAGREGGTPTGFNTKAQGKRSATLGEPKAKPEP